MENEKLAAAGAEVALPFCKNNRAQRVLHTKFGRNLKSDTPKSKRTKMNTLKTIDEAIKAQEFALHDLYQSWHKCMTAEEFNEVHTIVELKQSITNQKALRDELGREELHLAAAASAIIGYTSSLKDGQVINQGYIDRLNNYYVANLKAAIKDMGV